MIMIMIIMQKRTIDLVRLKLLCRHKNVQNRLYGALDSSIGLDPELNLHLNLHLTPSIHS